MRIPVLTYHAANVAGPGYADNDHVALAADLRLIDALGWQVVSLDRIVEQLDAGDAPAPERPCLGLSFDDGTDFDVRPIDYPGFGVQPGFLPILRDFGRRAGARQPTLHATCFVIASPAARTAMDRRCLFGGDVMNEHWWPDAVASGLLGIGNHSWDHNHEVAPDDAPDGLPRGRFLAVDNPVRAHWQIDRAQRYLQQRVGPAAVRHFGYPYGDVNAFLREDFLPAHGPALGLAAAWTTEGRAVSRDEDRWALPRFVCGQHWRSPGQLTDLLAQARG
jgi:peptidoglycan/xylan/chitin deacetylase (PgdA/CDA1 family)